MFDIQATLKWVTAVLTDPTSASEAYRAAGPGWQQSFLQLPLPLYVGAYVIASIVALITGGSFLYGGLSFGFFVFALAWGLAWTFVIAFIFDFLAGTFGGKRNFDASYGVVALAIIPSAAGTAISPLPWIGWLISLAASIYSLMLAYRFLPLYLEIPEASRVKHFVVSIIAALVVNLVVSLTIGSLFAPTLMQNATFDGSGESVGGGMLGGFERQANLVDAAGKDAYNPPSDGEISGEQMQSYIDVLRKTKALRERLGESMKVMEEKEPSLSDVFSGVGGAVRLGTAEMEVVKTGGGNWAEHQWVKSQLETARIQQDLNDTTEHNYELFLRYQEEIEQFD